MRVLIHRGRLTRVLIVCPKSLLRTWYEEISRWAPELSITTVHGAEKHRRVAMSYHVYITNYETVRSVICANGSQQKRDLKAFDLMIVDEIQNLKTATSCSALWRLLARLNASTRGANWNAARESF